MKGNNVFTPNTANESFVKAYNTTGSIVASDGGYNANTPSGNVDIWSPSGSYIQTVAMTAYPIQLNTVPPTLTTNNSLGALSMYAPGGSDFIFNLISVDNNGNYHNDNLNQYNIDVRNQLFAPYKGTVPVTLSGKTYVWKDYSGNPWNAFTVGNSTIWSVGEPASNAYFVTVDFGAGNSNVITKTAFQPTTAGTSTQTSFYLQFQGSQDNSTWTTFYTSYYGELTAGTEGNYITNTFLNNTAYRYYRLYWPTNNAYGFAYNANIGQYPTLVQFLAWNDGYSGSGAALTNINAANLTGVQSLSSVNPSVFTTNSTNIQLGNIGSFNGQIPVIYSNATFSSVYSGGYPPYLYDGLTNNAWNNGPAIGNTTTNQFITIDFGSGNSNLVDKTAFLPTIVGNGYGGVVSQQFRGSQDNVNWTTFYTATINQTTSGTEGVWITNSFVNTNFYRYYQIYWPTNLNAGIGNYPQLYEFQMFTDGLTGNGSLITSLNGSQITSGTVPAAQLPLATTSTFGAVKVGTGLSVSSGTVSGISYPIGTVTNVWSANGYTNLNAFPMRIIGFSGVNCYISNANFGIFLIGSYSTTHGIVTLAPGESLTGTTMTFNMPPIN